MRLASLPRIGLCRPRVVCACFVAKADPVQWRELAYCITQLQISDKGLKTLAEHLRLYKHTLTDSTVLDTFRGIAVKGKKSAKAELKDVMTEWERQLVEAAGT